MRYPERNKQGLDQDEEALRTYFASEHSGAVQ